HTRPTPATAGRQTSRSGTMGGVIRPALPPAEPVGGENCMASLHQVDERPSGDRSSRASGNDASVVGHARTTVIRTAALMAAQRAALAAPRVSREAPQRLRRPAGERPDPAGDDLPAPPTNGAEAPLTPRQREILGRLADGLGTTQIAVELSLSPATVRNHVR